MKNTVLVMSTNRAIQEGTRTSLDALTQAGAELVMQRGSADVAFARNMALSAALRYAVTRNKLALAPVSNHALLVGDMAPPPARVDTLLMIDDDMFFTLEQAQRLVDYSRKSGVGASAMYATLNSALAATRLYTEPGLEQRWLVGLGLLAVPLLEVQALAKRSQQFEALGEEHIEFTWSAALGNIWQAEDYCLCRRLGGVHLLPMAVGHLKTIPMYPDEESIACIRDGKRLPGDIDSKILARVADLSPAKLRAEL